MRVLEVSLRKAGYSVTTSADVDGALELIELTEPDMILADTRLPGKDGFALVEALKARHKFGEIPLVFLSSDPSVESRVRGLELGVEDYLTKPVYIREILTRVNLVMQRKEREGLSRTSKTRFAGALADMGLVDLLQTIDVSRKSGVLHLTRDGKRGAVYFHEGRVIDAEFGGLAPDAAIYRFLLWSEGEFELDFREVRREDKLGISTQGLLMEGMRRLDEVSRLQEQLPAMGSVLDVNHDELAQRLAEIPDEINEVLRLFDGRRTLGQVVDESRGDDLATLNAINKLYFEGFLLMREAPAPEPDEELNEDLLIGVLEAPYLPEETDAVLATEQGAEATRAQPEGGQDASHQAASDAAEPRPAAAEAAAPAQPDVNALPAQAEGVPVPSGEVAPSSAAAADATRPAPAQPDANVISVEPAAAPVPRVPFVPAPSLQPPANTQLNRPAQAQLQAERPFAATPEPPSESEERISGTVEAEERVTPVPVAAVKLKRVAVAADSIPRRGPVSAGVVEAVKTEPSVRDPRDASEPSASELERDMGKRARQQRGEARRSEPPAASTDNVIPLPVGRAEPAAPAANDASAPAAQGKRKKGRGKHKRGATKHEGTRPAAAAPSEPPEVSESEPPSALESEPPTASDLDGTDMLDETEGENSRAAVQRFFSEPPAAPPPWEDEAATEESASRGKRWAVSALVVGALSIGSFLIYSKLLTPAPEPSRAAAEAAPTTDVLAALASAPQAPVDAPPAASARTEQQAPEPPGERPAAEMGTPSVAPVQGDPPAQPVEPAPEGAAAEPAPRTSGSSDEAPARAPEGSAAEPAARTPTSSDEAGYSALVARARKQGLRRAAESTYLQALAIRPDGAEALSGLAMLYLNQGKNAAARDRAREAIRADDASSEAWIVLGAALSSLGDAQGAREAYTRCAGLPSGKYVSECRKMLR